MLKYFVILAVLLCACFCGCGDNLNPLESQDSNPQVKTKEIISSDGAPMVLIPAGEFQMGQSKINPKTDIIWEDELPIHTVYIDAFYMDVYEVTNAQYKKFVQATGHSKSAGWNNEQGWLIPWQDGNFNEDNQPIVCVCWEDANAYAEWAGKRLPTEAEWEKAARGSLSGTRYAWGDNWPPPKGAGNLMDETAVKVFEILPSFSGGIIGYDDGYVYTAPVGSFTPNSYGLYDMVGNVWEWCADWFSRDYYAQSPSRNPTGPSSGSCRVLRGGSWDNIPEYIHVSMRGNYSGPTYTHSSVGFRCAMDAK